MSGTGGVGTDDPGTDGLSLHVVGGGTPTDAEQAAIVEAVRTVLARRRTTDRRVGGSVWAHAGRLEAHGRRRVDERVLLQRA